MKFSELDLPQEVRQGILDTGFTDLTPVQEQTIPLALEGKDVAAQAQTGTGKTAAFLISLFTRLLRTGSRTTNNPRALILAPTRELVVQICEDAKSLGAHCPLKVQPIFGGVDYEKQRQALRDGVDVIVATPGRLIDYLKQRVFSLGRTEALVIDEADRMFDMGFISDLRWILRRLPDFEKRQTLLLSATLDRRVMELAYEFMDIPERVSIEPEQVTAERVEQVLYHVSLKEKFPLLLGLLKQEAESERVLLFVNTKVVAEKLNGLLNANDLPAAVLSGDIPQRKRMRLLQQFKDGELRFLVATDVASRGIHVDGVTHVFNYDLPQDPEDYVHRIGRTARAGADGKAISLADEDNVFHLPEIEEYIGRKIPSLFPEEADLIWDYAQPARKPRGGNRPSPKSRGPRKGHEKDGQQKKGPPRRRRRPRRKPGSDNSSGQDPKKN